jgi:hypothetical protein
MAQRVEKISSDHAMASATQAQARNGRRVIRRDASPQIVSISDTVDSADLDSHELITLPPKLSSPTTTISQSIITLSPLDMPTAQFRAGLSRRKENRHLLMEWVRSELVDGVDFGRVHIASKDKCEHARFGRARECNNQWHWSKPSLFKPGAEKISGMLGMTVHYPSLPAFETAVLSGVPITCVMLRCELHDAHGQVVAEGVGARNLNQDYGDFNKALKMAEKSAHIDATLRLAGLSEVFTQDLEDRPILDEEVAAPQPAKPKAVQKSTPSNSAKGAPRQRAKPSAVPPLADNAVAEVVSPPPATITADDIELVSADEVAGLRERIRDYGFTEKRVLAWLYKTTKGTVKQLQQLSISQCVSLLKRLDQWAIDENVAAEEDNP